MFLSQQTSFTIDAPSCRRRVNLAKRLGDRLVSGLPLHIFLDMPTSFAGVTGPVAQFAGGTGAHRDFARKEGGN